MKPLISIITVTYNSEKTLADTINSVLNQEYEQLEYILIDGKSTDSTIKIISSFESLFKEKDIRYTWISEKDNGIYDAMNKGLKMANGELIGIINSDDWYCQNTLNEIVKKWDGKSIISGNMNRVNSSKKVYKTLKNVCVNKNIHKKMPVNHPATFVPKEVYNKIGLFDINYKLSADYDLIYRAFINKSSFIFLDKTIVNMRNCGATGQLNSLWITAKEDHHIRKKNNVKFCNWYYFKRIIFNCLVIIRDTLKLK